MKPHVINFHITDICNYNCKYCFAKYHLKDLPLEDAKRVIDEAKSYFDQNGILNGRINIAGGEPTLYPYIEEIIRYIKERGMSVSIITNGSHLTPEFCLRMAGTLDMIGISIDASTAEGNRRVGRCSAGRTPDFDRLERAAHIMKHYGIRLKVNTVVSKLNLDEDLLSVYNRLQPDKLKIFCMHVVENVNGKVSGLIPTQEEYNTFVERNSAVENCTVVIEGHDSMQNAYFMINPQGEVYMNDGGTEKKYGSCLETPLPEIFKTIPLSEENYSARYRENAKSA